MLDLNIIAEFSRANCAMICAFLVPANLLATGQTLIFTGKKYSSLQLQLIVGSASFYAILMLLHVYTWFSVGIVMIPTYILLSLGGFCLATNLWAIAHSSSLYKLIKMVTTFVISWGEFGQKKSVMSEN